MLDEKAIRLINRLIDEGLDVEIQARRDHITILSEKKTVAFTYPRKKMVSRK